TGRAERTADVGERGDRVGEEHRAEAADRQVEALPREVVDLRVGLLERDVGQALGAGEVAGPLDGRRGDVDPERAARPGHARGRSGGLPVSASDVEDVV